MYGWWFFVVILMKNFLGYHIVSVFYFVYMTFKSYAVAISIIFDFTFFIVTDILSTFLCCFSTPKGGSTVCDLFCILFILLFINV